MYYINTTAHGEVNILLHIHTNIYIYNIYILYMLKSISHFKLYHGWSRAWMKINCFNFSLKICHEVVIVLQVK